MIAHLAQVNIARMGGPLESAVMADFVARLDEAKKRLAHLEANGPTPFAFTFKRPFPPGEAVLRATDWSMFEPCPSSSPA